MKKTHIKTTLFLVIFFAFLFFVKDSQAAGSYQAEGTAFYAQTSPSAYAIEGIEFYAFDPQAAQPNGTITVYRYYNSTNGDHFYTTDNISVYTGYTYESIAFYAYDSQVAKPDGTASVYRFYNSSTGDHFYTDSENEKDSLINNPQWGYAYEGIAFFANSTQINGTVPVYRFYNSTTGDHFYTALESERDSITLSPVYRFYNPKTGDHFYTASDNEKSVVANTSKSGYVYEGTAFYAFTKQSSETSPVYRLYNAINGDHFYTASENEKNSLTNNSNSGYAYEGIAFYAFSTQSNGTYPVYRLYNTTTGDHFYTASENEKNSLILSTLGPEISVGLWYQSKTDTFQIDANKSYNIRDNSGNILAQVGASTTTSVSYDDNKNQFKISGPISTSVSNTSITFDAVDGDNSTLIFDAHRPNSSLDHYRGKIKIQYYRGSDIYNGNTGSTVTQIFIINILPLEHYVWGDGEMSGTGPMEHTKVMATIFRTYGYWYIKYATKYAPYGFKIRSDSGSQVYSGYDWETQHLNIKTAAQNTRGIIVSYDGDVALTPYSSWSDGRTRSYEERWGSKSYPWCQSVDDPYGKDSSRSTDELIAAGNHMVGLIAHGSLNLSDDPYNWTYSRILRYYYTDISLSPFY